MTHPRPSTALLAPAGTGAPAEPLWMLRINPLRRRRASDPGLRSLLTELLELEQAVQAATGPCTDELYQQIGSTVDTVGRRLLVAQRRAVHNDRDLPAPVVAPRPATVRWLTAREQRQLARARVREAHPGALDRERMRLRTALDDPHLLNALALVAPEVLQAANRYRAAVGGGDPLSARLRKSERGLVQYVTRAMVRTSPLSQFTAVGLAVPGELGTQPDEVSFDGAVSFPGLDRVMLSYVLAGLQGTDLAATGSTWVQLAPTTMYEPDGTHVYFLRLAPPSGIRRLATPLTPAVRLLLGALAMGPRQARAVAADVADRSGRSVAEATQAVLNAVRAGILCTATGPEDGDAEFDALLGAAPPVGAPLLAELRQRLPALATAAPAERVPNLDRMRSLGLELGRAAGRPATILVEEDYVLPPVRVAASRWLPALDDVAAGVELLSLFDQLHDVRALLAAAFVERFGIGASVPLADHADQLAGEVVRRARAQAGAQDPRLGPADGSLERLHALRGRVLDTVHARIERCRPAGEDVLLPVGEARAHLADLPARFRHGPLGYAVLVQPWQGRLIFNDAYAGHGILAGRFLAADRALGGAALPHLARRLQAQYGAGGSRVVEDRGLHRLNVNAHAPVLPEALGPDDWSALRLVHDPDSDQLRIRDRDGASLRVLTLGAGHPERLPAPLRVASWLVSGGRLVEFFVDVWHQMSGGDGPQTRAYPRLFVGSAMLARRRWYGGAELAAAVAAGPDPADGLAALTAWRARHGVAEEVVFKTPLNAEDALGPEAGGRHADRLRQKPQYVDLASALHTRVLPRLLERRGAGYLEEALPAVEQGGHATEWVIEVSRVSGGSLRYGGPLT